MHATAKIYCRPSLVFTSYIIILTKYTLLQVPGYAEWYNIVYDGEEECVYTYKLADDMEHGDLKLTVPEL
jgi:hypothetical protein